MTCPVCKTDFCWLCGKAMDDVSWHYSAANLWGCSGLQMNENLRAELRNPCHSARYYALRACHLVPRLLVAFPLALLTVPTALLYYPLALGGFLLCALPREGRRGAWHALLMAETVWYPWRADCFRSCGRACASCGGAGGACGSVISLLVQVPLAPCIRLADDDTEDEGIGEFFMRCFVAYVALPLCVALLGLLPLSPLLALLVMAVNKKPYLKCVELTAKGLGGPAFMCVLVLFWRNES